MKRTHSQQQAHTRVLASNLKTISEHRRGGDILQALVTLADCGPYGMWQADAICELIHGIMDREEGAADIAALRITAIAAAR